MFAGAVECVFDLTRIDVSGNFIDTSNNYQFEESEKWIGEWMKKRGNRDEIGEPMYKPPFVEGFWSNTQLKSSLPSIPPTTAPAWGTSK